LVNVSNSTVKNIFENGMIPKLIKQKPPTTVWDINFGPIEQTVCPNTTGGDQQKKESSKDITFSH
jgi:hypothetical protein